MAKLKIIKMIPKEAGAAPKYISADTKLNRATQRWVTDIKEAGHFPAHAAEKTVAMLRKISSSTYVTVDPPEVPTEPATP